MKKIIICIAAGLLSVAALANPNFGVKGGLSVSGLSGLETTKAKPDLYLGGMMELPINNNMGIILEALYSGEGAKMKSNSNVNLNLAYLSIPVLFDLKFGDNNQFDFNAGLGFNFLLSAKTVDRDHLNDTLNNWKQHRFADVAAVLGATWYITNHIGAQFRYNQGMINTYKEDGAVVVKNAPNYYFQLGVVYKF